MWLNFCLNVLFITIFIYQAQKATPTTVTGIIFFFFLIMSVITLLLKQKWKRIAKADVLLMISLFSILLIHKLTTSDTWGSVLMCLFVGLLIILLLNKKTLNIKTSLIFALCLFVVQPIIFGIEFIKAIISLNEDYAFEGFFQNSNMTAIAATVAYLSSTLIIKNRFQKQCILVLYILYAIASMSRNVLLFIILFFSLTWILKHYPSIKKILYIGLLCGLVGALSIYLTTSEEEQSNNDTFGKSGSRGRITQVQLIVLNYPLNFFGNGRDEVNEFSNYYANYPVHNGWIGSTYSYGLLYLALYLLIIYTIYKRCRDERSNAALLAFQVYIFFEPHIFFELSSYMLLFIVLALDRYKEKKVSQIVTYPIRS